MLPDALCETHLLYSGPQVAPLQLRRHGGRGSKRALAISPLECETLREETAERTALVRQVVNVFVYRPNLKRVIVKRAPKVN
jgi:hypothetical protein